MAALARHPNYFLSEDKMTKSKTPEFLEQPLQSERRHVKVAIIGAGSAGLSARREVSLRTDDYVVIDGGPLGTTCARVGCMPSKVLIQAGADFHRRTVLAEQGILGADALHVDRDAVFEHVRSLRDRFVRSVKSSLSEDDPHLVRGYAELVDENTLRVGEMEIEADQIIFATGSSPIVPKPWRDSLGDRLLTTDELFELEHVPARWVVVGLGVIGLEMGQALANLGAEVHALSLDRAFGGLSDSAIQDEVFDILSGNMNVHLTPLEAAERTENGVLATLKDGTQIEADRVLVAIGRRPNLGGFEFERFVTTERGIPSYDPQTMRIEDKPWFIAGDVAGVAPLLHEASDEGRIAGRNAASESDLPFVRRTPMAVTFSEPPIAVVGARRAALVASGVDFATGVIRYKGQGRAIVKLKEYGLAHLYADKATGRLLGAEMVAPGADHLAHLLAWSIQSGQTVWDLLAMPFYHPVLEEGLRTALRGLRDEIEEKTGSRSELELPVA